LLGRAWIWQIIYPKWQQCTHNIHLSLKNLIFPNVQLFRKFTKPYPLFFFILKLVVILVLDRVLHTNDGQDLSYILANMDLSFTIVALLLTVFKASVHAQNHNRAAPCPPGKLRCDCGQWPQGVIQCNGQNASLSLMINYCLTYSLSQQFVLGCCPFNLHCKDLKHYFLPLPPNVDKLNNLMCGKEFNRASDLCGECRQNYSHPMYFFEQGFRCINCTTAIYSNNCMSTTSCNWICSCDNFLYLHTHISHQKYICSRQWVCVL